MRSRRHACAELVSGTVAHERSILNLRLRSADVCGDISLVAGSGAISRRRRRVTAVTAPCGGRGDRAALDLPTLDRGYRAAESRVHRRLAIDPAVRRRGFTRVTTEIEPADAEIVRHANSPTIRRVVIPTAEAHSHDTLSFYRILCRARDHVVSRERARLDGRSRGEAPPVHAG
jgi:hypothetical protein